MYKIDRRGGGGLGGGAKNRSLGIYLWPPPLPPPLPLLSTLYMDLMCKNIDKIDHVAAA